MLNRNHPADRDHAEFLPWTQAIEEEVFSPYPPKPQDLPWGPPPPPFDRLDARH